MFTMEYQARAGAGWGDSAANILSLDWIESKGGPVLVATGGANSGVLSLRRSGDTYAVADQAHFNTTQSRYMVGATGSSIVTVDGENYAVLSGLTRSGRLAWEITQDGLIGDAVTLETGSVAGRLGSVMAGTSSGSFHYGLTDYGQLGVFATRGDRLIETGTIQDTAESYLMAPVALEVVRVGNTDFLLSLCGAETGLSAFRIGTDGGLTFTDSAGVLLGLGLLNDPTDLATVRVEGQTYVVIASAADGGDGGALSVLRLDKDGSLSPTDHLLDSLHTRFGKVQAVEVLQVSGWTFVVAGGGDAGLSLFTLLPDGRLVHLDTLANTLGAGLDRITDIALSRQGDMLDIVVSSQGQTGLAHVTVDLSDRGVQRHGDSGRIDGTAKADLLNGGKGAADLRGNDGDDILVDGRGSDRLTGGAGRDIFVLEADGATDVITDFHASQDWIDLSAVPMLYGPSGLEVQRQNWGALLRFRDGETTEIRSRSGDRLSEEEVLSRILWGADRPPLGTFNREKGTDADDRMTGSDNVDILKGEAGNDLLDGRENGDILDGGAGADTLFGGEGWDELYGGTGPDSLDGGSGNDLIQDVSEGGVMGRDTILAGSGDDTVASGGGDDLIYADHGRDDVFAGTGHDTVWGGDGNDTLVGFDGNDRLMGEWGNDLLEGGLQNDFLDGGFGADSLSGGGMRDTLLGGPGEDLLEGQFGADEIWGGLGHDSIHGGGMSDRMYGGPGHDTVNGWSGPDGAWLGHGNDSYSDFFQPGPLGRDTVWGGGGNDTIHVSAGDDLVHGQQGDDLIFAGLGFDTITGGYGRDTIEGGGGNDLIEGGPMPDRIDAGAGNDTVTGGTGPEHVTLGLGHDLYDDVFQPGFLGRDSIWGGGGNDTVRSSGGDDILFGQRGRDVLVAGAGFDTLDGGAGRDRLDGGNGNDVLAGGMGQDRLIGGRGADRLTGGLGADQFVFNKTSGRDRITDFKPGEDQLLLDVSETKFKQLDLIGRPAGVLVEWDGGAVFLENLRPRAIDAEDVVFL